MYVDVRVLVRACATPSPSLPSLPRPPPPALVRRVNAAPVLIDWNVGPEALVMLTYWVFPAASNAAVMVVGATDWSH